MPDVTELLIQAERVVRVGLTILITYFIALWIAAIWWTFQDIRSRTTDVALQIAATLLVIVFSFPGLLVYFMLRPQRTVAELYSESLEEEALFRSMNERLVCPSCQEPVEPDFLFCPWCQARLRQPCPRCERPILLRWRLCPYCGSPPTVVQPPTPINRVAATTNGVGEATEPLPQRQPRA